MKTLHRFAYIALFALSIPILGFAQPPDSLWSRTYGGPDSEECYYVQQTSDGGYVLAGNVYSSIGAWLVKTDTIGDSLWSRNNSSYTCYCAHLTADGGYVLAGFYFTWYETWWDFWLCKRFANGDNHWSRTYAESSDDECFSVQQTLDGGYILAGYTQSYGAGSNDFWLVKTNGNGTRLWHRTFGGYTSEGCLSVKQTSDSGYVMAGWTYSFSAGYRDFWMVKTNVDGDSLWSQRFGGSGDDYCTCVLQSSDGGYILAGSTVSFGVGRDFWIVKTDANGDSLWSRTYGGVGSEECYSAVQISDGGYVLVGSTSSYGAGSADFWIVRTDSNGTQLWDKTFGGSSSDVCRSVQQTTDGGYILGGHTRSFGAGNYDFWLVKTGPDPAATEPRIEILPAEYTLHQNYPNPFNPSTRISYDLIQTGRVTLKVFDVLGRTVATLVDGMQTAGNHSATFDGSGLASGIYLCRLQIGDWSQTRKMVLLK
ncbi:T9SS type A sorting domain-containing protein [bacterium]|nr:T9SS type A sorting domain-containing protein [bacterium]